MLNRVFGPFDTQGFQISRAQVYSQVYSFPLDLTGDDVYIFLPKGVCGIQNTKLDGTNIHTLHIHRHQHIIPTYQHIIPVQYLISIIIHILKMYMLLFS